MNEIKVYEELTYIETYDDKLRATQLNIEVLGKIINEQKFLNLWDELLNTSNIKRVFRKKLSDVEQIIYSIDDKEKRKKLESEIERRTKDWLRVNAEIIQNILAKY